MASSRRSRKGRPPGIEIRNAEQLRYDIAQIGDRRSLARRLQKAIEQDERRPARKYPYLPQASTVWQWLKGRPVGWPGHGLRDLARFIHDQTGKSCDRNLWLHPPAKALHVYGAPRRPSLAFRGRELELAELRELLASAAPCSLAVAIEGLPGIGKTELALHVAYAFAAQAGAAQPPSFPGGIYWLDAEQRDLTLAWDGIAQRDLKIAEDTLGARVAELLRRIESSAERTLLILDNVFLGADDLWDKDRGRPFPLPEGPQVRLLCTTRNEYFGGPAFAHRPLGVLPESAARELLLAIADRDPVHDAERLSGLEELLEALQGHALAIEASAMCLRRNGAETPLSLLKRMQQGEQFERDARLTGYAVEKASHEATVQGAFAALWTSLDAGTRCAWQLAAQFRSAPVSLDLSEAVGLSASALAALHDFHLIGWDFSGKRWRMHRLTRRFGQTIGDAGERSAAQEAFVQGCVSRAAQDPAAFATDPTQFEKALELAPQVLAPEAELRLLLSVGPTPTLRRGAGGHQRIYDLASELAARAQDHADVFLALEGVRQGSSIAQRDLAEAEEAAVRIEALSRNHSSSGYRLMAYLAFGETWFYQGRVALACAKLEEGAALYRAGERESLKPVRRCGVSLLSFAALAQCLSGFPDRALRSSDDAIELAREIGDPAAFAMALLQRGLLHRWRQELDETSAYGARALQIGIEHKLPLVQGMVTVGDAWTRIIQDPAAGLRHFDTLREASKRVAEMKLTWLRLTHTHTLGDACLRLGLPEQGMAAVEEGLRLSEATGRNNFAPELWRIRAALSDSNDERIHCLERALQLAQGNGARWFGLRAATDLVEAANTPELRAGASDRLRQLYSSFAEGLDLRDLVRARQVLGLRHRQTSDAAIQRHEESNP